MVKTNCRFVMGAIIHQFDSKNWREWQDLNLQVAGLESAAPSQIALHSRISFQTVKDQKKTRPKPGSGYTAASRPLRHDSPHRPLGNHGSAVFGPYLHKRIIHQC